MFAAIRDFLYRHRRKFYIGGGVIGGLLLLSKFAEYKIYQLHDKQTHQIIERQKRRQHYEKTRQTANATVLSLSSSITKIVTDELDIDELLQTIRTNPSIKIKLWEDLKVQGFSRCIASIYTASLVGCVVHSKLMLLGGYTYGDDIKIDNKSFTITHDDQEKYLSYLQKFVEEGLPGMIRKIQKATLHRVRSLSLDQLITLEQLEGILKDITLLLSGENIPSLGPCDSLQLQPWSHYVAKMNIPHFKNPENILFYKMTDEIIDVIDSKDFSFVIHNLIQHGISILVDYITDYYPQPKIEELAVQNNEKNHSTSRNNDISVQVESINKTPMNGLSVRPKDPKVSNPHTILIKGSLPVAKIVPVLSDVPHPFLSPAPGHLLQFVLLNEHLENLSFNIYEAFSV